jgi:hypothetical protein
MTIIRRRSRSVTFRVSAEEYDDLSKYCVLSGARSISDFARDAVLHSVQALRLPAGTLSGDLATLGRALAQLDATLSETRKRIRGVLGPMDAETGEDTKGVQ